MARRDERLAPCLRASLRGMGDGVRRPGWQHLAGSTQASLEGKVSMDRKVLRQVSLRTAHIAAVVAVAVACVGAVGVPAARAYDGCVDGVQESGAKYRICMPRPGKWNGDLIVYAHGYVAFNEPIEIPEDQLSIPDGPSIPELANLLGYAFATTSYQVNGLAVNEGVLDLLDLVSVFSGIHGEPRFVYLAGVSEGGIITALSLEQHPDVYDGGLSACGPVGDFWLQIEYWGDTRVLFDHYFPGTIPGTAMDIPPEVIAQWDTLYEARVESALRADPDATAELLRVAHVPADPDDPDSGVDALVNLMWYNVFATNDGREKLGGQPFDNRWRFYLGSSDDKELNRSVARFAADAGALQEIGSGYRTSGNVSIPVVTLHTAGDPIVPYWHQVIYRAKVWRSGAADWHVNVRRPNYGHCSFTAAEALAALILLIERVQGSPVVGAESVLWTPESRSEYRELMRELDIVPPPPTFLPLALSNSGP